MGEVGLADLRGLQLDPIMRDAIGKQLDNWDQLSRRESEVNPKTEPQAKAYNGTNCPASGGAVRWSRDGDDTRQLSRPGPRWKRLEAVRRLVSYRVNTRFMPIR